MARVNIRDVADRAGVSTATVSHVINQTRFVREETRRKVLEAVEALNYHPSTIARGLATNTTQTIGLIISDITNPFFTAVARGVEDEFNQFGYHTIFCNTDEDSAREDEYLRLLFAHQIDGLIIAPTGVHSDRLLRIAEAEIPIVLLDRAAPGITAPLVHVDNEGGAYQATRYLIELGHRRIGILTGMETISTLGMRVSGYRRALQEAGISIDEALIIRADPRFHKNQLYPSDSLLWGSITNLQMTPNAFLALQKLLDLPDRPTALFVTNNQMTLGTLHAFKERKLHCPEDISLVSFDDHDWAPLFAPPLTVVRQPTYQLGQTAAKLLLKMINHQEFENPSPLPVELIIRESCAKLSAHAPLKVAA
ncbi:MAG: LacI family DNA-binding transcriptional regulator [Anaerolineales bacterium]|nr:LacI family DNA-binding transcriptional regulator [Anaerolineales bacterium]